MTERPPMDLHEQRMSLHRNIIWLCRAIEKYPKLAYHFGGRLTAMCEGGDITVVPDHSMLDDAEIDDVADMRSAPLSTGETLALAVLSGDDRRVEPALADYLIGAGIDPVVAARESALREAAGVARREWDSIAGTIRSIQRHRETNPITLDRRGRFLDRIGNIIFAIESLIDPPAGRHADHE